MSEVITQTIVHGDPLVAGFATSGNNTYEDVLTITVGLATQMQLVSGNANAGGGRVFLKLVDVSGSTPVELPDTTPVRIIKRTRLNREGTWFVNGIYGRFKELSDLNRVGTFADGDLLVGGEQMVLQVMSTSIVDGSDVNSVQFAIDVRMVG